MKKIILCTLLCIFLQHGMAFATYVKGYTTKNGTYVSGHYRSNANYTMMDNYSTRGNYNPYTGSKGYVNPYNTYKPKYNTFTNYGYRRNYYSNY